MLSFLSPLFLVGAAAAAVPIVLHLLKREPEARVQFAAVKLLKKAPVEGPGADRVLARAAIDQAAAGFGATRYRAALSTAAQHFGGRHGTIVVVTDLQETGWDAGDRALVPDKTSVDVVDVGAPPPN